MADEGASQGPPSPQRVEQARREGMFPFSRLLVTGGLWLALGMACIEYGPAWATGLADGFHDLLRPAQPAYHHETALAHLQQALLTWARSVAPPVFLAVAAVLVAGGLQTRFQLHPWRWSPPGEWIGLRRRVPLVHIAIWTALAALVVLSAVWFTAGNLATWFQWMDAPLDAQAQYALRFTGRMLQLWGGMAIAAGAIEFLWRRRHILRLLEQHPGQDRDRLGGIETEAAVQRRQRALGRSPQR